MPKLRCAFTLIELLVVLAIVAVLTGLLLSAVMQVRAAAARAACLNNIRQLGLAAQQHHCEHGQLPPGVTNAQSGPGMPPPPPDAAGWVYPWMTWHTRLLPYLEQDALWRLAVNATAGPDPNASSDPPFARPLQRIFHCPADYRRYSSVKPPETMNAPTSYLGVAGLNAARRDGVLFVNSRVRFAEVTDGLSNTLLAGERPSSFDGGTGRWYGGTGFWSDTDVTLGVRAIAYAGEGQDCAPGPYGFVPDRVANPCAIFHFWSTHPGGGHFLFCDGSGRFLSYSANSVLPALASRAGGEVVSLE